MAGQWMKMFLVGISMWATCFAAPMECHFNSQVKFLLCCLPPQLCVSTRGDAILWETAGWSRAVCSAPVYTQSEWDAVK
ncbi:hypothetical protein P4O66_008638, partial [Electrophorus voltai]